MIECVGPRHTESASTNGTMNATMRTHDSSSNNRRNDQPAKMAAKSFAKFSGSPQPASANANAASAKTTVAAGIQRRVYSGKRQRDEQQRRRHDHEADEDDVGPQREIRRVRRGDEPRDDRGRDRAEPQYGGRDSHHTPSGLNAFQKRVFCACSSSDSSMSGV